MCSNNDSRDYANDLRTTKFRNLPSITKMIKTPTIRFKKINFGKFGYYLLKLLLKSVIFVNIVQIPFRKIFIYINLLERIQEWRIRYPNFQSPSEEIIVKFCKNLLRSRKLNSDSILIRYVYRSPKSDVNWENNPMFNTLKQTWPKRETRYGGISIRTFCY